MSIYICQNFRTKYVYIQNYSYIDTERFKFFAIPLPYVERLY